MGLWIFTLYFSLQSNNTTLVFLPYFPSSYPVYLIAWVIKIFLHQSISPASFPATPLLIHSTEFYKMSQHSHTICHLCLSTFSLLCLECSSLCIQFIFFTFRWSQLSTLGCHPWYFPHLQSQLEHLYNSHDFFLILIKYIFNYCFIYSIFYQVWECPENRYVLIIPIYPS